MILLSTKPIDVVLEGVEESGSKVTSYSASSLLDRTEDLKDPKSWLGWPLVLLLILSDDLFTRGGSESAGADLMSSSYEKSG
jgi:hypothetical protein